MLVGIYSIIIYTILVVKIISMNCVNVLKCKQQALKSPKKFKFAKTLSLT